MTKTALAAILATSIAVASTLVIAASAARAGDDWDKDWTALTLATNGAWGSAIHALRVTAMMQAMAQCRERAGSSNGCGSHTTTVRGAWAVGYVCGTETFVVTARSYREAQVAAINQEIELRDFERVEIEACRRIIAIAPNGEAASEAMLSEVLPLPQRPCGSQVPTTCIERNAKGPSVVQ